MLLIDSFDYALTLGRSLYDLARSLSYDTFKGMVDDYSVYSRCCRDRLERVGSLTCELARDRLALIILCYSILGLMGWSGYAIFFSDWRWPWMGSNLRLSRLFSLLMSMSIQSRIIYMYMYVCVSITDARPYTKNENLLLILYYQVLLMQVRNLKSN